MLQRSPNEQRNSRAAFTNDKTQSERGHRSRRRDLSRVASRHHRTGAAARHQASRRTPSASSSAPAAPSSARALAQLAAEGLVELRRNRGAAVATPSWNEARDIFDVRLGLERLVVIRLAGSLTREQIKTLKDHVDAEEQARGNDNPLSIRLATAFHILLAELTGNPVLTRYVSEVASRCGLIWRSTAARIHPNARSASIARSLRRWHTGDRARATR